MFENAIGCDKVNQYAVKGQLHLVKIYQVCTCTKKEPLKISLTGLDANQNNVCFRW
jgi:uncharacterized protein (DUF39 family)